jgi:D-sedoheptulose 7-phosphate isomerase
MTKQADLPGDISAAAQRILGDLVKRHKALMTSVDDIVRAYDVLLSCFTDKKKLLLCGNGGSYADVEHISGELAKGFLKKRPLDDALIDRLKQMCGDGDYLSRHLQQGLPAIPLGMHALSTAAINDLGGDLCFAQQVMALGDKGDALIAISTSGNARNVYLAAVVAKALDMSVIAFTGSEGGILASIADVTIKVDETKTYKIQELHLPTYHALCAMLEESIYT